MPRAVRGLDGESGDAYVAPAEHRNSQRVTRQDVRVARQLAMVELAKKKLPPAVIWSALGISRETYFRWQREFAAISTQRKRFETLYDDD